MAVHAVIGDELKPHLSQLTGSKVSSAALSKDGGHGTFFKIQFFVCVKG